MSFDIQLKNPGPVFNMNVAAEAVTISGAIVQAQGPQITTAGGAVSAEVVVPEPPVYQGIYYRPPRRKPRKAEKAPEPVLVQAVFSGNGVSRGAPQRSSASGHVIDAEQELLEMLAIMDLLDEADGLVLPVAV